MNGELPKRDGTVPPLQGGATLAHVTKCVVNFNGAETPFLERFSAFICDLR